MADPDRYYGLRLGSVGSTGGPRFGGLIRQSFTGGLTMYYLSHAGWVEDNGLLEELHDGDSVAIDHATAAQIARSKFGLGLDAPLVATPPAASD